MISVRRLAVVTVALLLSACGSAAPKKTSGPSGPYQVLDPAATAEVVATLQRGDFGGAKRLASDVLGKQRDNAQANVARAIASYQLAMHNLIVEARSVMDGAEHSKSFDHARMRRALEDTDKALAGASDDLAAAEADPNFAFELCLACWTHDWNMNGRLDHRDELLLQVEYDETGNELPEGDPRRKPTIRFDVGDLQWGQAMLSFQRAALQLVLAYDWKSLDRVFESGPFGLMGLPIVIPLRDKKYVTQARDLILKGLDHSDRARIAYLAETDDDREWLPSPRQKSFPLPLPVDEALYATWEGVVSDVRGLVKGDTGISVAELIKISGEEVPRLPTGYIDIGRMLAAPKDLRIDVAAASRHVSGGSPDFDAALSEVLGEYYAAKKVPTPLVRRLGRMAAELNRGEDRIERKLRYLFWIN